MVFQALTSRGLENICVLIFPFPLSSVLDSFDFLLSILAAAFPMIVPWSNIWTLKYNLLVWKIKKKNRSVGTGA